VSGLRSRNKGKVGEREVATLLREAYPDHHVERSWQVAGATGKPDVVVKGLPVHIEVGRSRRPNPVAKLRQAERDAKPGFVPISVTRADGDTWIATLRFGDLIGVLDKLAKQD